MYLTICMGIFEAFLFRRSCNLQVRSHYTCTSLSQNKVSLHRKTGVSNQEQPTIPRLPLGKGLTVLLLKFFTSALDGCECSTSNRPNRFTLEGMSHTRAQRIGGPDSEAASFEEEISSLQISTTETWIVQPVA
jgi:hypothetical protein